jgi:hypothetical protein
MKIFWCTQVVIDWENENMGNQHMQSHDLQYIITDYYQTRSKNNRAIPVEMICKRTAYDARRYRELLTQTCNSVTEPFGLKF